MNSKSLGVLILIAIVVALLAGGAMLLQQREAPTTTNISDLLFPSLGDNINNITTVRIENTSETIMLASADGGWVVENYEHYPARFEPVKKLIMEIVQARPVSVKTNNKELLHKLDLDDPNETNNATRVTLLDQDDATLGAVIVGKSDSSGQRSYVRKADQTQSYLADTRFSVMTLPAQWIDPSILKLKYEDVWTVHIAHPSGDDVYLSRETPDDANFTLMDIPAGRSAKPPSAIRAVANSLSSLLLIDVRRAVSQSGIDAAQAESLGITNSAPVVAEFTTFDNSIIRCNIWVTDGTAWITLRASSDTEQSKTNEIHAQTQGWVYQISQDAATRLTTSLESVLEPLTNAGPAPAEPNK